MNKSLPHYEYALDIHYGETIGLVIETQCNYLVPLTFPHIVDVGIQGAHLGASSVRYEVGIFASGKALTAEKRRPVILPTPLKTIFNTLI